MSRGIYDKVNKRLIQTAGKEKIDVDHELSSSSQNAVENRILNAEFNKTYRETDTSETTIADEDYFPFYDTSASTKKRTLWDNIVSKIKASFGIASISPFGNAGSLPSATWTVSGEEATFNFNPGTLPTPGTTVEVATKSST